MAVRVLGAGLGVFHGSGLVRRDLSRRNVILADDGARVIGAPGFMSPEQARVDEIGPERDVFWLGWCSRTPPQGTRGAMRDVGWAGAGGGDR
ncbi:hypothetical protein GCM10009734_42960 [Nonomuraea bangladeshensis]